MDFAIEMKDGLPEMTFSKAGDCMNNLYLSLAIRRGSFFARPEFGLRELPQKGTDQNIALIREYHDEALRWMVRAGKLSSLAVEAWRDPIDRHRVNILVEAVQADGRKITYETFQEVV